MKTLLLLLLLPITLTAQSIEIMPQSVPLWGQMDNYHAVSVTYEKVSLYYFHTSNSNPFDVPIQENTQKYLSNNTFALSYEVLSIQELLYLDFIYFEKPFPLDGGAKFQFKVGLSLPITETITLNYTHISNGFGIQNEMNDGVDFFSIKITKP